MWWLLFTLVAGIQADPMFRSLVGRIVDLAHNPQVL